MTTTNKRTSDDLQSVKSEPKKFKKSFDAVDKKKFGGAGNKYGDKPGGDKKFPPKKFGDKKFGDKKFGDKKFGDKKFGDKKFGDKKFGAKKFGDKKFDDKKMYEKNAKTPRDPKEPLEKPDWKKMKEDKKNLRLKRKSGKDLFELTVQAMQIYEKLKCKTTENKENLAKELHEMLKGGSYAKLVLSHDTARVVQCMLKQAPTAIKTEIADELIPSVVQMCTSKYSHFCVSRMLKYGTNGVREKIVNAMMGNVVKMVSHALSSSLIDSAYLTWATNKQKAFLRQELYGDIYKLTKDDSVKSIADTYKDTPLMKKAILTSVKAHLEHSVNKKLVDNSLVHSVLADYLTVCEDEDRAEISTVFNALLPELASTKDGARAATLLFWYASVKDRRSILKSLKEHLTKLCTHEHGYALILAILSTLDDTVAMKKTLLDNILKDIELIADTEWGRKIVEWIVSPGDKSYFHPSFIASIEEGQKYSKKDVEVKRAEILAAMEKPICVAIATNPSYWVKGGHTGLATAAVLKVSKGDHLKEAMSKLAQVICDPDWTVGAEIEKVEEKVGKRKMKISPYEDEKKTDAVPLVSGIEEAGLHVALKKMFKNDKEKLSEGESTLGGAVVEALTEETLKKWLPLNRACFLLVNIFENGSSETQSALKKSIKPHVKILKKQTHAGSKILQTKLEL